MLRLARENPLGFSNGQQEDLESLFQQRLCCLLNDRENESGWCWRREIRYQTRALRNMKAMSVDVFGEAGDGRHSAAIELKYVPTRQGEKRAPNPAAFPYDLLKDCLKIELLASGHSRAVESSSYETPSFGYVIAMTNVPRILSGTMRGWSQNYLAALCPTQRNGEGFTLGPCQIETWSPKNLEKVIYSHKRHHLSLGKTWNGRWTRFGDTDFRFVMLSTDFRDAPSVYHHSAQDSRYIPFLNYDTRKDALRKAAALRGV